MNHRKVSGRDLLAIPQFTEIRCNLLVFSFFKTRVKNVNRRHCFIIKLFFKMFQYISLIVRQWCSLLKYFYILNKIVLVDLIKQNGRETHFL